MGDDAIAILNLLYIYAEHIDAGDFAAAADLFAEAEVTVRGKTQLGSEPILRFWRDHLRIHPDGTPRCKHVTTNPILSIGPYQQTATVRSTYMVLQATEKTPLQVITAGRYQDGFRKRDGSWRFASRIYAPSDLVGNVSDYFLN